MYWNSLSSFSEPLLNALFHSNLFFTLNLVCPLPRIDSTSLLIAWKEFTDIMAFYSEVHLLKIIIFSSRSTIPGSHLKHLISLHAVKHLLQFQIPLKCLLFLWVRPQSNYILYIYITFKFSSFVYFDRDILPASTLLLTMSL